MFTPYLVYCNGSGRLIITRPSLRAIIVLLCKRPWIMRTLLIDCPNQTFLYKKGWWHLVAHILG